MTADELKRRRLALALTQSELATLLGVIPGTISRYERGDPAHPIPAWLDWALRGLEGRPRKRRD